MNVLQLVAPVVVAPINARKVSPEKALAKAKKAKPSTEAVVVVTELNALRAELQALSGAPCSPKMTIEQLKAKIEAIKNPTPEVEEVEVEVVEKAKVIPAKAQGIGDRCVALLKDGLKPKDVLMTVKLTFPEAKTSMAAVYWYKSKINCGVM